MFGSVIKPFHPFSSYLVQMAEGERHVLDLIAVQSARRFVEKSVLGRLRRALSNVQCEQSNRRAAKSSKNSPSSTSPGVPCATEGRTHSAPD